MICNDSRSIGIIVPHGAFSGLFSLALDALLRIVQLITQDLPEAHRPTLCYLFFRLLHIHSLCQRTLLLEEAFSCMLAVYGFLQSDAGGKCFDFLY